ncbi:MAG: hypothetical protein AB1757_07885 [Acidobacteriota bacterium]
MFKCQICGNTSQPRTPAYKVVLETRNVKYPFREKVNACWKWKSDRRKFVHTNDTGGSGQECVREVLACADCAAKFPSRLNKYQSNGLKNRR